MARERLRHRVFLITAIQAAMLIGITFVLSWRGRETQRWVTHLLAVESRAVTQIDQLQRNQSAITLRWNDAASRDDVETLSELVGRYRSVTQLADSIQLDEADAAPLRAAIAMYAKKISDDAFEWALLTPDTRLQRLHSTQVASDAVRREAELIIGRKQLEIEGLLPRIEHDARNTMLVALGIAWIVALLGFVIARMTLARVVAPLEMLSRAADGLASGDYSVRVRPAGSHEIFQLGVEFNAMAKQLEAAKQSLERQARTDELTGLANFRSLREFFDAEIERFNRYEKPFGVLVFDLDRFKSYNDDYGHLAGNEALQAVAQTIRHTLRAVDFPARYGGEEFVAVIPEIDERGLAAIAERVRRNVEAIPPIDGRRSLTVSIGGAIFPTDGTDATSVFAQADARLYRAKESGRNRVIVAETSGAARA